MAEYDVIIAGGGVAGTCCGAILTKMGKKVLVLEKEPFLGGRCFEKDVDGFTLAEGGHMMEDTGSGIGTVFKFVGEPLETTGVVNDAMPVWYEGGWHEIRDLYKNDKDELKKIIRHIVSCKYSDFDQYDNMPVRTWLRMHTDKASIILLYEILAMLECLTINQWYDCSASEFLYTRKLHYEETHKGGYSVSPKGGFSGLSRSLAGMITQNGGKVETGVKVSQVLIDKGHVVGVEVERDKLRIPNIFGETEVIKAPTVICTLPVWNILNIVPEQHLPMWYVGQIKNMSKIENRTCWFGFYAAVDGPIYIASHYELAGWLDGPITHLAGFAYMPSTLDAAMAPPGKHLFCRGATADPLLATNKVWLRQKFEEFDQEMDVMFPQLKKHLMWKKRNLVLDYNVIQKPGLVGAHRPDNKAPNIEGLWLAGDTYKSRQIGVDRAARSSMTVAEGVLGTRIPAFEKSWHY
jgi:phytoene dehydrogenase-like protein